MLSWNLRGPGNFSSFADNCFFGVETEKNVLEPFLAYKNLFKVSSIYTVFHG